jgi:hypothetical protein
LLENRRKSRWKDKSVWYNGIELLHAYGQPQQSQLGTAPLGDMDVKKRMMFAATRCGGQAAYASYR